MRDEFAAALKQTADRLNHLLSLWPAKVSHDDIEFARDLMLSRRNQLRHSELPMYINDAQTYADLLDRVTESTDNDHDAAYSSEVSNSLEPLRLVIRKYARKTDLGLRFPSNERVDQPRLSIKR
ncbi:MAG: hypothetical protein M3041_03330 [Acidobacteriota bacterium]|nr:hypothetical protein [Acidobacteriota bacterium]